MPPTTRRNTSDAATQPSSSPPSLKQSNAHASASGSARKRKASTSATRDSIKKQKDQEDKKLQQTLDETLENGEKNSTEIHKEVDHAGVTDKDIQDAEAETDFWQSSDNNDKQGDKGSESLEKIENEEIGRSEDPPTNAADSDEKPVGKNKETTAPPNGAIEESLQREKEMSSNILEKGIIYFFSRARVGLSQPSSVQEIARSYLVLRPLPASAKLGDGPIDDLKNSRLLALPKKVLPKSSQDRFMIFVEKSSASVEQLKNEFMTGSRYDTQSSGVRSSPPVTPLAEGVYAIISTGRDSHLAYMLTMPSQLGEVQEGVGLADKGSFILSTKNPETKGPAIAQFDHPAEFSKDIMERFAGRRWMPTEPKHLDYVAAQLLLIGEAKGDLGKAVQHSEGNTEEEEEKTIEEELNLLQDEDLDRVQALHGDDTIFDDLRLRKKDYPQIQTTW